MLKSSSCDYRDAYILAKGRITITGAGADAAARSAEEREKGVIFNHCAAFINCKSGNKYSGRCKNINDPYTNLCVLKKIEMLLKT